jgi:class 3 adenylate cyclase
VFRDHGGYEAKEIGDGFLVAFVSAGDAVACAVAGQRALAAEPWPAEVGPVRVRMALHTGDVQWEAGEYHSLVLHHASRILVAGHGGQILCSEVTTGLLRRGGLVALEVGLQLVELGVYRLRDVETPERLFQVEYPGMARREFPPLKAPPGYASHVPPQLTRFFGRGEELTRLRQMLSTRRPDRVPAKRVEPA